MFIAVTDDVDVVPLRLIQIVNQQTNRRCQTSGLNGETKL